MTARNVARGLAWFGIGLGLLEVLAPRAVARASGLGGSERLLQLFGLREIVSGAIILSADEPEEWLWTRVAGDVLDGALLTSAMGSDNPDRHKAVLATLAVAPVVILDIANAGRPAEKQRA